MKPAITDIPGIGPVAADALAEYRITTVHRLSRSSVEKVTAVPGFSEARAAKVIAAAAELLGTSAKPATAQPAAGQQDTAESPDVRDKKGKKDKDRKKGKGKGKDKKKDKGKGKDKDKKKGKGKEKKKGKT
jgi:hypothetical protein